jgi:hypothetical protein
MANQLIKYAENACEYLTMELLAKDLGSHGASLKTQQLVFSNLFNNYCSNIPNLTVKQQETFKHEIDKRRPLCEQVALQMSKSLTELYDLSSYSFDLVPMNKAGLSQGVSQKSDINIDIYKNSDLVCTKEVSLKLYVGKNKKGSMNTQVASGTYLSTLCGLGFDVIGRGSFATTSGDKFASKKSNIETIKKHFTHYYGDEIVDSIDKILSITNKTHELREQKRKPTNIDQIRKGIGQSAISPFLSVLGEINHSGLLKTRILKRTGLKQTNTKEMLAACFTNKGEVQVFNSLGNEKFHSIISKLNSEDCFMKFLKKGQGLEFQFLNKEDGVILTCNMPLTININGAWANKYRYDKLDDCYYDKGELRKTKSQQLDTSTNVWVDIGQIF